MKHCPLCQQTNNCQVEQASCWCFTQPTASGFIERVQALDINPSMGCLCLSCFQRLNDEPASVAAAKVTQSN